MKRLRLLGAVPFSGDHVWEYEMWCNRAASKVVPLSMNFSAVIAFTMQWWYNVPVHRQGTYGTFLTHIHTFKNRYTHQKYLNYHTKEMPYTDLLGFIVMLRFSVPFSTVSCPCRGRDASLRMSTIVSKLYALYNYNQVSPW